ncbi:MAG TPA: hypothetical protein VIJ34_07660 [Acidimicrobiales bacterium]
MTSTTIGSSQVGVTASEHEGRRRVVISLGVGLIDRFGKLPGQSGIPGGVELPALRRVEGMLGFGHSTRPVQSLR